MEREIIVKGRGQARSLPDRAVIDVVVDADGATKDEAYQGAADSAKQVDEVLSRRAAAVDRVITSKLMVHPKDRWKKGERIRTGWRATRGTTIEVTDFSQLGELIFEVTAAGGAVEGPSWFLGDASPARREARRLAAEDARRRAEDYAAPLGLTVGDVAWVSEPGLRGHTVDEGPVVRNAGFAASAAARGPDAVIDVRPDEITATASVEVGFRLE